MAIQIHTLCNKDRIVRQKKPLQLLHLLRIRIRLELEERARALVLFDLGRESKLRGTDHVKLKLYTSCYSTHPMRRTKAYLIYKMTKNLREVLYLLGHKKLESTNCYLDLEVDNT